MKTEETISGWHFMLMLPLYVTNYILIAPQMLGKKIVSQEELEAIVAEEAEKLGLNPSEIDARYEVGWTGAYNEGDRSILGVSGRYRTRAVVRHELYHIKKDCDSNDDSEMHLLLYQQPRASIYGLLRIRL